MKGLAGDLGTMPVGDLVLYLGNKGSTGVAIFENQGARKSMVIEHGAVINTASNDPREYLGQFLINFGHITEDQLNKAFHTQSETKVMLGRILVMIGLVSEERLKEVLAIKHRETLLSVFRWKEGTFKFVADALPSDKDTLLTPVPLLEVHQEAEFRETAWEAMRQVFPSGQFTLQIDESKAPAKLPPSSLDNQLFTLMREGQTVDDICLKLHATDFHLYQRLYALYRQGIVKPQAAPKTISEDSQEIEISVSEEPAGQVGEEVSAEDIMKHAREYLTNKQFAEAESLAARAVELAATPEARALLKETETSLLEYLRAEMVSQSRVPTLAVPIAKLKNLDLLPQEKYLLSRVDGVREVKVIIRVSPIRELDALKYFKNFVERGLLTLSEDDGQKTDPGWK